MNLSDRLWGIRCVWLRYFDVYRKNLFYGLMTTFVEPLLYLFSFGFGMGALIGELSLPGGPIPYRAFVLAGLVGQTVLFQAFFDAAYGGFIRMYYQRIFKGMALTPITLSEVLWAELFWGATKATFGSAVVLGIGALLGDFKPAGALAAVPLCFFSALLFSGLGLWVAAISRTIENISYPQYLLIFPMFLFCGVYFPITQLPPWLQFITWMLPLTPLLAVLRTLTLGFPLPLQALPLLAVWTVTLVLLSRRAMTRRLVK